MSLLCEVILAVGISVSDCEADTSALVVPKEDPKVFEFKKSKPPAPASAPVDAPTTAAPPPQKIIERIEVIREIEKPIYVQVPAPAPTPAPMLTPTPTPTPVPASEPVVADDPTADEVALMAVYQARRNQTWSVVKPLAGTVNRNTVSHEAMDMPPAMNILDLPRKIASIAPQGRYAMESIETTFAVDNERLLTTDRVITAILETSINTQLSEGGKVVLQTTRPVFGYHGRTILIPKGSRLVCEYTSPEKPGETRISIECKRILLAGHRAEIYEAAANIQDSQGNVGLSGNVDNRFFEKYGTAFLLTGISASVRAAAAMAGNAKTDDKAAIAAEASKEVAERFGEITASVLEQSVNLKPVIKIPQGTRMHIRPAKDWYIKPVLTPVNKMASTH